MNIFEITIQHRQEIGWPVVAEYSRSGELPRRCEGTLSLPEDYEVELRMLLLDLLGYGTLLGKALFRESVRDSFREALALVPHHLIDIIDPDDQYDAARFVQQEQEKNQRERFTRVFQVALDCEREQLYHAVHRL